MLKPIIGTFVLIAVIVAAISSAAGGCDSEAEKAQRAAQEQTELREKQAEEREEATERTERSSEGRRKGFHCLSAWDGNHDGFERLVKPLLDDPGSMETHETHITPVMTTTFSDDGTPQDNHVIRMVFSAKNAFGGRVRHTARGTINPDTCAASLTLIE